MVSEVPPLIRNAVWRRAEPSGRSAPEVIGYVSILLNAWGLRKRSRIGYTRAFQGRRHALFVLWYAARKAAWGGRFSEEGEGARVTVRRILEARFPAHLPNRHCRFH